MFTDRGSDGRPVRRHIFCEVGSVSSFGGNPMLVHLGIAAATRVDEVRIRWLASHDSEAVYRDLAAGNLFRILEGDPEHTLWHATAFTLAIRLHPSRSTTTSACAI